MHNKNSPTDIRHTPIGRISRTLTQFLEVESLGGVVLLLCTAIALILANSPFSLHYESFWKIPIYFAVGNFHLSHSLGHWINDGLMTIFFFVVGLEIKRELINGELKDLKVAILPVMAAIGGMILPALIYATILRGGPGSQGWGIPMATDIAFVVGFMALLGKRVPHGLKIFLLSLAIVDDIGAVIIIAVFYSSSISFGALSLGCAGFILIGVLNRMGVRYIPVYGLMGSLIWLAFLFSGVHPTVAGVLLGLMAPASAWISDTTLRVAFTTWQEKRKTTNRDHRGQNVADINGLISIVKETVSPLERLEVALHPWVAFFIMPLFALSNAGIPLSFSAFNSPISFGVALGLFLGKVSGIILFCWLSVRFIGSRLPTGASWSVLIGAGFLAGIGFTMSIFIASLALEGSQLIEGKAGTILGSAISSMVGFGILYFTLRLNPSAVRSSSAH